MYRPLRQLLAATAIALAMVAPVHAQATAGQTTVLPVWNHASGKVEALLYLEPASATHLTARQRFSERVLDTTLGLRAGDSVGLLCDRKGGVPSAIGNLANHCMLATMGSGRTAGGIAVGGRNAKAGVSIGASQDTLPAWLSAGSRSGKVEQNDLTVFGQKSIGNEGFVTIGGTVAKARLVPAGDAPALADRWNARSVSVGGGYRAFSGSIIGRVVDVPGQASPWQNLGLGITWRTPWSGQLTFGAENVVTRGRNPFAPADDADDQGTVPYVRYQQDL